MKRTVFHVTQNAAGLWECWKVGAPKMEGPVCRVKTKKGAVAIARVSAGRYPPSQVVVHLGRRFKSRIQIEYTYGADPRKYKG